MKKIVFSFAIVAALVLVSCSTDEVPSTTSKSQIEWVARDSTGGQMGDPNNPRPKP